MARRKSAGEEGKQPVCKFGDLEFLRSLPLALLRRVLRRWMMGISGDDYPPSYNEVERLQELVTEGHTGARFELRRRWAFVRRRDEITIEPAVPLKQQEKTQEPENRKPKAKNRKPKTENRKSEN